MTRVDPNFYIYNEKFQVEMNKSVDLLIKSWSLTNEDKEICLLLRAKHNRKAMEYLKKANEALGFRQTTRVYAQENEICG